MKSKFLLFLFCCFFVSGSFAYFYTNSGRWDVVSEIDVTNIENLPRVTLLDLRSGRLSKFIEKGLENGSIISPEVDEYRVGKFSLSQDEHIVSNGLGGISVGGIRVVDELRALGIDFKPYTWSAFFQIDIRGVDHLLTIQVWRNIDDTFGVVPYIIKMGVEESILNDWIDITQKDSLYLVLPATDYRDPSFCELYTKSGAYCKWWNANNGTINKLANEWVGNEIIPNKASKLIFAPIRMNINYEATAQ